MSRQSLVYLVIVVVSSIVALFAFGQAITLAWLSQSPAWEPELQSLQIHFWIFLLLGLIALVVGAGAVLRWIRR